MKMIRRFTIALAAAAFLAITAPSALAESIRPVHGVTSAPSADQAVAGPAAEQGVGTSPSQTEPEAAVAPAPEQGFGSSPGVVEPADPSPPAGNPTPTEKDKEGDDEQGTEEECAHREAMVDNALGMLGFWEAAADFLGDFALENAQGWYEEADALIGIQYETGCYGHGTEEQ